MRYGELTEHSVGIVIKEIIRRAMVVARSHLISFQVNSKVGYDGISEDFFTNADREAQALIVRLLKENFPDYGVIGEEGSEYYMPENAKGYFTIDPIDGTKAFIRRQSHGVAVMIAMVRYLSPMFTEIVSVYIGDVNTLEIYGYRPGSNKVHRISEFEVSEVLPASRKESLFEGYALLRDPVGKFSSEKLVAKTVGRFKNYLIDGSSIGTWFTRLWKGEVAALLIPPGSETPWDSTPCIGISNKLKYRFLKPSADGASWEGCIMDPPRTIVRRDYDMLVVHRDHIGALME